MNSLKNNKLSLGDLVNFKRGYDLPHRDREPGDVPIISSSGLTGWHKYPMAKSPGVVTGRYGTLGEVFYVDKNYWPLNTSLYVQNFKGNLPKFIYYYLKTILSENFNSAGAVPGVNRNYLHKIKVPALPKAPHKIAAILSAYDDLIENNKRRIALLENMAEEIYREWFVRFRFPGYQSAEFEKGMPKGWEITSLTEAVEINPKEQPDKDELKPYVGMEALSTNAMYFESTERRTGNSGSKFRNNDTLFPRITPCLENGKRGYVMCLDQDQVAVGSTEFIVFRENRLTSEYIYLLSCFEPFRTHAEISMVGASGRQRVAESCFSFFLIPVPPQALMDLFTDKVRPMFKAIKTYSDQNKALNKTKNLLLPRLISGKLSVEELDIQFPPSMQSDAA